MLLVSRTAISREWHDWWGHLSEDVHHGCQAHLDNSFLFNEIHGDGMMEEIWRVQPFSGCNLEEIISQAAFLYIPKFHKRGLKPIALLFSDLWVFCSFALRSILHFCFLPGSKIDPVLRPGESTKLTVWSLQVSFLTTKCKMIFNGLFYS